MNDDDSGFIYRFVEAIDFKAPIKRIKVNSNPKTWFDIEIISSIQRRNKRYKKFKRSGLETEG